MRRLLFAGLAFLVACNGGAGTRLTPPGPAASSQIAHARQGKASMRLTIPARKHRGKRPNTISGLTKSVTVVVNAAAAQVFNTTPSSPNCFSAPGGLTCTLLVLVSYGTDTFVVTTYSEQNGAGSALDQGKLTATVTKQTSSLAIVLGPVFSNAHDSGAGSLRQAVLDANPGDTILYVGPTPATVTLTTGPVPLLKNVTIAGPGATQLTISGNDASKIFTVVPSVTVTLSGLTIAHGHSSNSSGGAIFNQGHLTIDADVFSANSTSGSGSLLHHPEELVRPAHWAVRNHHRVRVGGHRQPRPSDKPRYVYNVGNGGAIYDDNCPSCTASLTITGSTFDGNSATSGGQDGGAIFNSSGVTLTVTGSTFTNNTASYGGAIESDGPATYTNDTFGSNSAKPSSATYVYGSGGAIHADGVTTITGCTFTANTADGNDASDRRGFGGAISSSGTNALLTVKNSEFKNNVAGGTTAVDKQAYGGAIWVNYGYSGTIALDGDTFTGNSATSVVQYAEGGAVDAADVYGGTTYPIVGKNNSFTSNTASAGGPNAYAQGGAISGDGASLTNSTFTSNAATAVQGRAESGAFDADDTVTLSGVTFSKNHALAQNDSYAGAMYLYGPSLNDTLTNVTFTDNVSQVTGGESSSYAGALYAESPTTISNGTFTGNAAKAASGNSNFGTAGAIYVTYPVVFQGTVSNNTAASSGGGFYSDDLLTIDKSTISGNQVTAAGAVDGGGGINSSGGLIMTASTVTGNSVSGTYSSSGGGGIFIAGTGTISNSTIGNNTSGVDGGGIENKSTYGTYSGPTLVNVTIYGNTATGKGGNLKNYGTQATLTLQNSIVAHGTAAMGSDISNDGTVTSADYNIVNPVKVAGNAIAGTTTHNLSSDPLLLALANNGGPTQTQADQTTSPGYNYIPLAKCTGAAPPITKDQRGEPRGDAGDLLCDVGAFELQVP